jgi:hypothetical protein
LRILSFGTIFSRPSGGGGAFRRFKDVLYDHRSKRERWFRFQEAAVRERVLEWLASGGIEAFRARATQAGPTSALTATHRRGARLG